MPLRKQKIYNKSKITKLLIEFKNNKLNLNSCCIWLKQECYNKYALGYNRGFKTAVMIKNIKGVDNMCRPKGSKDKNPRTRKTKEQIKQNNEVQQ